jgi:putative ABC transport system substrate-binding protein
MAIQIGRREFVVTLGGAAAMWPSAARAQQPEQIRRIGVLMSYAESDREGQVLVTEFRKGLQKLGWAEGRNIRFDYRWAALDAELMHRFAKELTALQPNLIFSHNTPTTAALLQQTRIIPIIFASLLIRLAADLSRACRSRAATSPVSLISSRRWPANG